MVNKTVKKFLFVNNFSSIRKNFLERNGVLKLNVFLDFAEINLPHVFGSTWWLLWQWSIGLKFSYTLNWSLISGSFLFSRWISQNRYAQQHTYQKIINFCHVSLKLSLVFTHSKLLFLNQYSRRQTAWIYLRFTLVIKTIFYNFPVFTLFE